MRYPSSHFSTRCIFTQNPGPRSRNKMNNRLPHNFFLRDVLDIAPELLGKYLVRRFEDGRIERYRITETEAYRGMEDLACHASKGRTPRTEIMFLSGGTIYV